MKNVSTLQIYKSMNSNNQSELKYSKDLNVHLSDWILSKQGSKKQPGFRLYIDFNELMVTYHLTQIISGGPRLKTELWIDNMKFKWN